MDVCVKAIIFGWFSFIYTALNSFSMIKNSLKTRIETGFGRLGYAISRHPLRWLLGYVLIIALLASQLVHLRTDTSIEGFLAKDSPALTKYDEFKATFGRDEMFIIDIEVDDVFQQDFVDKLRSFHQQLEDEVPYLASVDSLINARHTWGDEDSLIIEDLLPYELPTDPVELDTLKSYTYDNPNYQRFLFSPDGKLISVVVKLEAFLYETDSNGEVISHYLEDHHQREAMNAIYRIMDQHRGVLSDTITVAGSLPVSLLLAEIVKDDFAVFSSIAIILIALVLFVIFRRASGVLMPMVTIILGVVATISMMAILDSPIQMTTSILPSFLLAVCVGDSIHLLSIFYRQYDIGKNKVQALVGAMEHTGLAMFFTSITTAAGLASFSFSELLPVSALGTFGAIGSMLAFLLTIFVLPCLICLFPIRHKTIRSSKQSRLQKVLYWCANVSTAHPKRIVIIGLILFAGSIYVASTHMYFGHAPLTWLPKNEPSLQALLKHEKHMGASMALEVMFDTGKEGGVNNPAFLSKLDAIMRTLESIEDDNYNIAKTISVTDIVKESNRALHGNDQAAYSIPNDAKLISQELFLVELDEPDDLFTLIDRKYQTARLTLLIPWIDAIHYTDILTNLQSYLEEQVGDLTESITITGVAAVLGSTFAEMIYSTAQSYTVAAGVISIMMILLVSSVKLGLLSMLPSLLPICMVLALLSLTGYPMDMFNMLIGSIAIGLTVDDNVHFIHGFKRVYGQTGNPAYAIEQTLTSSGRAMLVTSIVLSIGFLIYTQSELTNMIGFGILTALCICLALMATFLFAPALMMLCNKTYQPAKS